MAISQGGFTSTFDPIVPPKDVLPLTSNWKSTYDFTHQYMPDLAEQMFQVRSKDSIRGFIDYFGMTEMLSADKHIYAESGAKHSFFSGVPISAISTDSLTLNFSTKLTETDMIPFGPNQLLEVHDTVAGTPIKGIGIVTAVVDTDGSETLTLKRWDAANWTGFTVADTCSVFRQGSSYKKGSDGPNRTVSRQFDLYSLRTFIAKHNYKVNGSDLVNATWLRSDGGEYFWTTEDIDDERDVYEDDLEKQLITGEETANSAITDQTYGKGSDGVFDVVKSRGGNFSGYIDSLTDIDNLVKYLDQAFGEQTNMMYLNRAAQLGFSNMAGGLNSGWDGGYDFGSFGNAGEKMLNLNFRGVDRGPYTFLVSAWKMLNNPEYLGNANLVPSERINGLMVPFGTSQIADDMAGGNVRSVPYLTVMNKGGNGYSRAFEQFNLGSANLPSGQATTSGDYIDFQWRAEKAIRTIAAHKFMLFKGANS